MFDGLRARFRQKKEEQQRAAELARKQYLEDLNKYKNSSLSDLEITIEDVILKKNEVAYYMGQELTSWLEPRKRTKSVSYSGVSGRVKIAKGVYIKTGSIKPMKQTQTTNVIIHQGVMVITNKRILLINHDEISQITYRNVVQVVPYSDGMAILRSSGKKITLTGFNGEIPSILLTRILTGDTEAHN